MPARLAASEPSRFIEQHAMLFDPGLPILDAPCGFGRNSLFLAKQGYEVVAADIDRERLGFVVSQAPYRGITGNTLKCIACDLNDEGLPFANASFGTLVVVHFIPKCWKNYIKLLTRDGYLLFETMGGHGGNYLELPRMGEMRAFLDGKFKVSLYRERLVGPSEANAATVRFVARKL